MLTTEIEDFEYDKVLFVKAIIEKKISALKTLVELDKDLVARHNDLLMDKISEYSQELDEVCRRMLEKEKEHGTFTHIEERRPYSNW
jgi:hypothetical protein